MINPLFDPVPQIGRLDVGFDSGADFSVQKSHQPKPSPPAAPAPE
jgi:hypothetical protein